MTYKLQLVMLILALNLSSNLVTSNKLHSTSERRSILDQNVKLDLKTSEQQELSSRQQETSFSDDLSRISDADYTNYPAEQTSSNIDNSHNSHKPEHQLTPFEADFSHLSSSDFQGSPSPVAQDDSESNKEFLNYELLERTCHRDRGCQRKDQLNNTYLNYCTRYKLEYLFSTENLMSLMHDSVETCKKILTDFIQLDEKVRYYEMTFESLLSRYNCHNGYSVKWNCEDCKKAYKDWLCATYLPYFMNGYLIKPCISFCERVEQRCPYLHPITKEQYGGQPVFICRDPNIPFIANITNDIPYSEPSKCYDLCHLSDNLSELIIDSLSKYEHNKCPPRGSIAAEVRSDALYCQINNPQANESKRPTVDVLDGVVI